MTELPLAPFERILKSAGAKRVSEEAARELCNMIEDIGYDFAHEAIDASRHAGRKTVKERDIRFVRKQRA